MEIRYLEQDEKDKSRQLYESAFPEDSDAFVDYYYSEKCKDNQILVMEEYDEVVSMIHLNPFTVSMYGNEALVNYIVAVATDENYRMKGYMRQLMERAFHDMYEEGQPFVFLTPANPDYYYSCGFEYWESQMQLLQDQEGLWNGCQRIDVAGEADCEDMAAFSNKILAEQFDLYMKKDLGYYQRLIKEQECDGGHLLIVREWNTANGQKMASEDEMVHCFGAEAKASQVGGIFCLNKGHGFYIREPIMAHSCSEYTQASMMGRIIDFTAFCSLLKSKEPVSMDVRVRDTMIPENEGCYHIAVDENGGSAKRIYGLEPEVSMDIAEVGQFFFDKMRIYINEVV